MEIIISCLIAAAVSVSMMGLIYFLNHKRLIVAERLEIYVQEQQDVYLPPELNKSFKERALKLVSDFFSRISSKIVPQNKKEAYEKKLLAAGNPCGLNAVSFLVLKYFILFLSILLGLLSRNALLLIIFMITGFVIPDFYLRVNEKKRKELFSKSLPDVLDLLSVSVEAGLSFDAALQKITEKYSGPLSDEFSKVLNEINMGRLRSEALRDMANRIDVEDVTVFIGSIIQADQLGVSISNVLRLQSAQVRANRRMKAEEKAQQAPIKILIPLVLFVFPTILIILLGPAVIHLLNTFK